MKAAARTALVPALVLCAALTAPPETAWAGEELLAPFPGASSDGGGRTTQAAPTPLGATAASPVTPGGPTAAGDETEDRVEGPAVPATAVVPAAIGTPTGADAPEDGKEETEANAPAGGSRLLRALAGRYPVTWHGRLRARLRGFGGRALAGHARKPDPEAARTDPRAVDLPVRVPAMDARFRRICAVFADGRCLIAEGYEPDDRLRLDLVALRQSGAIPPVLTEESVPLEEIAALWRAAGTPVPGSAGATVDGGSSARRVRSLLADAAAARASDVVFEQGQDACKVFCIVNDRKLPLAAPLTAEEGRRLMGFLFHCKDEGSSQTSYRRSSFQGFSIRAGGAVPLPGGISALRCERGPHDPDADHLFARLFYTDRLDADMTLERLGFSEEEAALFAEIRMAMQGGVFIGGRAGDGKSTTLAVNLALQMAEMSGQLNLITLEDPVEYRIPGAIQIAVPTAGAGETRAGHFKQALMHFCRVHPASGMVSEIRDADAARQVLQCVDTGHQIWTTIHVHNANAIPFRLIDMGVGPAEVAKPGNVALLMKQTLLPKLCRSCALDRPAEGRAAPGSSPVPEGLISRLGGMEGLRFRNAEGCEACRRKDGGEVSARAWNGYLGQTAIAETIRPDAGYLGFVRQGDPLGAWAYWRKEMGGVPIGVRIRALVKEGAVDPFDALLKGGAGEHEAQADRRPEGPVGEGVSP